MSAAEIGLVTCDVLTNAVVAVPEAGLSGLDQTTVVPEMKLLPFTVRVKPGSPAVTLEIESEEIDGVGPMDIGPPNDAPPPQADHPTGSPSAIKHSRPRELILLGASMT